MTTLLLSMLLAPGAFAQEAAAPSASDMPGIDAHGFVLAAFDSDPRDLLTLQRPSAQEAGTWFGGGLVEFAKAPLVAETPEGETVQVVDNVFAVNASGGFAVHERIRVDVAVPLYLTATGLEGAQGVAIGDVRLASMLTLLAPSGRSGFGLGVVPWLDLPTGADDRFLGQSGVAGGALAAASLQADALTLTGNLGAQLNPTVERSNLTGSDSLVAGLGVGWLAGDGLGINGEVRALAPFVSSPTAGTGTPVEGIASVRYARENGSHVVGGLASGLSPGVGSAAFRVFVGGGFGNGADVSGPSDPDGDGFVGRFDACPDEPESLNGLEDDDGCPEDNVQLSVVVTRNGAPIAGATIDLQGPVARTETSEAAPLTFDVPPETLWKAKAKLGLCLEGDRIEQVRTENATLEIPLAFVPGGLVKVVVRDGKGIPVSGATATFASEDPSCVPGEPVALPVDGKLYQDVGLGTHTVKVEAPGYAPFDGAFTIELGAEEEIIAVLVK